MIPLFLSLASCKWLDSQAKLERDVAFAVSITPSQIYEGQQTSVSIRLLKDYAETKNVQWKILAPDGNVASSSTEFISTEGNLSVSGSSEYQFTITSRPGSVSGASNTYQLVMTSTGFSASFNLTVLDSGTSSTVSIVSAQNNGYVNAANQSSYTVSGVCSTNGSDVTVVAEINSELVSNHTPCTGLSWSIPLNFTSVSSEGTVLVTATHAGGAGSIGATSLQIQKDTVAPTVSISNPGAMTYINGASASSFSLDGLCSEENQIVSVSLSSSGGGGPVQASGVCLDVLGTKQWSSTANISSLNDGTITASVGHLDPAGNSANGSRAFQKDTVLPVFAIVSPVSLTTFNASNYQSLAINGTCNKAGASIALTGDVSGTLSALCNGTNFSFTGLTLTGSDGVRTITATMSDSAGNSSQANLSLQKNILVPTLTIASPAPSSIYNASTYQSLAISGTCNKAGATVNLTGDVSGTLSAGCNGSTFSFAGLTLTGANGTRSITATISDVAGNSSFENLSLEKDILVPTLAISSPTSMQVFNSTNYQNVTISGTCNKASSTVTASGPLSGTLTTTCNGSTFSLAGLTLTGVDGVKNLNVGISDAAGNSSNALLSVVLDVTLPTAVLSGAPAAHSNATALNVTVGGSDVSQYLFKVGDSASVDCSVLAGYSAAIGIATPITSSLGLDGSKRLCVLGRDSNGNTQDLASATEVVWTKDIVLPVVIISTPLAGSYVNSLNVGTFAVTGTCTENGVGNVIIQGSATANVGCTAGAWNASLDFSAEADGPVFILVTQTDAAGNVGQASRLFTKEVVVPTIAFTSPASMAYINNANKAAFAVSGTCSDYSASPNIAITGGQSTVNVACDGANWSANIPFADGNDTPILTATITDQAGNPAQAQRTFTRDTTNPTVEITSPLASAYVNSAQVASFAVSGTCTDPGSSNVVISGDATGTVNCTGGNTWSANLNFTSASQGAISITATHTDAAGNTHQDSLNLQKDTVAPAVSYSLPLAGACLSNSTYTSFAVSGTCTNGDGNVRIASSDMMAPGYVDTACAAGSFNTTVNLSPLNGQSDGYQPSVSITQTDAAGNPGQATRLFTYFNGVPTIVHGGWDDVYAVGAKTYADGTPAEPGVVRVDWKSFPAGNTCQPDLVRVYRASSSGGSYSQVSGDIIPTARTFTDSTLTSPDFGKAWYYKLRVVIMGTEYTVPDNAFSEIRVVAPPDNMGLMHRWIANQEMCGLMNRTTDATNHYRCGYSGWGKVASNHYDMEHDMLVDRNELACNYTNQCGAGGNQPCLGSEFSVISPAAAGIAGANGQVFYTNTDTTARCWVKAAGTWYEARSTNGNMTPLVRAAMSTNMGHRPPLAYITQTESQPTCQAHTVSLDQLGFAFSNRPKRLLRNKEWKAAAAWPQTMTDAQIVTMENGGSTLGRCNSDSAHGNMSTEREIQLPGVSSFYTGSQTATAQCTSRYGLQDMVGNVWEWTSDQLGGCSGTGLTCAGVTSGLDAGNDHMNGFLFDNSSHGPGGGTIDSWNIENKNHGAIYFSVPLGLPMLNSDSGNAILIDNWLGPSKFHSDGFYLQPWNSNVSRGLRVGGRWSEGANGGRWASA